MTNYHTTVAVVTWRRQGRDADEFIESFQNMYDEGELEGSAEKPRGVGGGGGGVGAGGERSRRYDPKARPFVGECRPQAHSDECGSPVDVDVDFDGGADVNVDGDGDCDCGVDFLH